MGGGESFISGPREVWERTFAVDWWGVYYCARAFLSLLIASGDGVLVNTSSVNGFWAALGPGIPNSAYSTAKFAVKGFTEALIEDLRADAPEVRVAVVMPGHVGTDIIANSLRARGLPTPEQMSDAQVEELIPRLAQAARPSRTNTRPTPPKPPPRVPVGVAPRERPGTFPWTSGARRGRLARPGGLSAGGALPPWPTKRPAGKGPGWTGCPPTRGA